MIPVFKPSCTQQEIDAVSDTLKSGWWGAGPKAKEFEDKFKEFIGSRYALALSSATAALHLAGKILNLEEGSEVIVPAMTFISTAYVADYNNLKVVFADVEEETLNIDPEDIKRKITDKTKIIVPVHYGGHACRMDEIMEIARENNLTVVEDCAHAAGAEYKGRKLGSIGDFGCFSFQAVKNLATGDGGMLTTNNKEYDEEARKFRWLGISKDTSERTKRDEYSWKYLIDRVGYKFQMCDLLASLGIVQLKRLNELNKRRKEITKRYNEEFSKLDWITIPAEKGYTNSSNHNYVIKIKKDREKFMKYLKENGISSGVHYMPLYLHPLYSQSNAKCPIADQVWKSLVTLPLFPDLKDEEVDTIIKSVKGYRG